MTERTYDYWKARAREIVLRNDPYIDGEFVPSQSGNTYELLSPTNGKLLANVAACDESDVNRAVRSGCASFQSGAWSERAPADRKQVMLKLAQLITSNCEELALLESMDMGKPIADAIALDLPVSAELLCWYAELADKVYDQVAPTESSVLATITREPIGVVAAVVPWNFALTEAVVKLAPALVAGNSVVLKPAESSPHSVLRLAELATDAGLPKGVLNVVPGLGHQAGKSLGLHADVDCVTFTGSTAVGKKFLNYSSQSNMKPVWLETGGKSPNIVFEDFNNLDKAAAASAAAVFYNAGQFCVAPSRLLVHSSIKEEFVAKLVEQARSIQIGDPLDPATTMGPLVNRKQAERVLAYIAKGIDEGASLRSGGKSKTIAGSELYIEPTVFEGVNNQMTIARDEIFGPVLSVISFESEEEAIEIANDTPYGLAAALWTDSLDRAHRVSRKLRAGSVSVNTADSYSPATPHGGYKESGIGRDLSTHALDNYTQVKTTWIDLN